MQAQHIPKWTHQLHTQIVVEVLDFITAAFQLVKVGSCDTHHIGQLIHGFLALV